MQRHDKQQAYLQLTVSWKPKVHQLTKFFLSLIENLLVRHARLINPLVSPATAFECIQLLSQHHRADNQIANDQLIEITSV